MNKTIFIPIAACREPHLINTIRSALLSAENPKNIYFGIFNTVIDNIDIKKNELEDLYNEFPKLELKHRQIIYKELHSDSPMGVGYSRLNASCLFNRYHDFIFQIDSHTIFEKHWDTKLINNYYQIKNDTGHDKIILSTSPLRGLYRDKKFYEASYGKENLIEDISKFNEDQSLNNSSLIIKYENSELPYIYGNYHEWDTDYHESNLIHAAVMFSEFNLIRDIMHDPYDNYHGDQLNYTLRALSRGYRIFSFKNPVFMVIEKEDVYDHTLEETNWRYLYENFTIFFTIVSKDNRDKILSGKEFSYWGAPDKKSLMHAKEKMQIEKYSRWL